MRDLKHAPYFFFFFLKHKSAWVPKLKNVFCITFVWIPSHCSITGNSGNEKQRLTDICASFVGLVVLFVQFACFSNILEFFLTRMNSASFRPNVWSLFIVFVLYNNTWLYLKKLNLNLSFRRYFAILLSFICCLCVVRRMSSFRYFFVFDAFRRLFLCIFVAFSWSFCHHFNVFSRFLKSQCRLFLSDFSLFFIWFFRFHRHVFGRDFDFFLSSLTLCLSF